MALTPVPAVTRTDYVMLLGKVIAKAELSGVDETITYLHADLLGSPRKATYGNGTQIGQEKWREHYDPWGMKLNGIDEKIGYTGHAYDAETSLTYMQARFYDPLVGRFLSTDPIYFSDQNPFTFNRYAYANNNPYKYTDPTGMCGSLAQGQYASASCTSGYTSVDADPGPATTSGADKQTGTPNPAPQASGGSQPAETASTGGTPTGYVGSGVVDPMANGEWIGGRARSGTETAAILAEVRQSNLVMSAINLTITAKWDFAINADYRFDTFNVDGQILSPSEFGNYVAGYAGAYHGGGVGVYGALLGGIYFDIIFHRFDTDFDQADQPFISDGAIDGSNDRDAGR